jgi:hypothetical protein
MVATIDDADRWGSLTGEPDHERPRLPFVVHGWVWPKIPLLADAGHAHARCASLLWITSAVASATRPTSTRLKHLRATLAEVEQGAQVGVSADRAVEWLRVLKETWQGADIPQARSELLHAFYDRIVIAGPASWRSRRRRLGTECPSIGGIPRPWRAAYD